MCGVPVRTDRITPANATICSILLISEMPDSKSNGLFRFNRPGAQLHSLHVPREGYCLRPSPCGSGCDVNHHTLNYLLWGLLGIRYRRCSSWLNAVKTPIAVQQKMMRHTDMRKTINIYGDVVTDEMSTAALRVAELAFRINGAQSERESS